MPDVCVSRCRTVTSGATAVPSIPRKGMTCVSSANAPPSTCCSADTAVKSFVIDAVSKRVSSVFGTCHARLAAP